MTEHERLPPNSISQSRRLVWFIFVGAAISLALTAAAWLAGGSVPWTAWTLPVIVAANTGVTLHGGLNRRPRLARLYFVLSLTLAGAMIVAATRGLMHR